MSHSLYAKTLFATFIIFTLFVSVTINGSLSRPSNAITYENALTINETTTQHLSFGYKNMLATLFWFKTNAYYGANIQKTNYNFLAELFHVITTLNPKFEPVYYMAASILPWNTGSTKLSNPFTLKSIVEFPYDWRWTYYRGFNAYWFEHNYQQAAHYFELSSTKPNAPPLVSSLAARMRAETNNIDTGINFLARLLQNKNDSNTHHALSRQYKQLQTEKQLRQVEQWLKTLPHHQFNLKSIQYLKEHGYPIPAKLADGGTIIFINNQIVSSKIKKRFKVFIPPKYQGVVQHESTH